MPPSVQFPCGKGGTEAWRKPVSALGVPPTSLRPEEDNVFLRTCKEQTGESEESGRGERHPLKSQRARNSFHCHLQTDLLSASLFLLHKLGKWAPRLQQPFTAPPHLPTPPSPCHHLHLWCCSPPRPPSRPSCSHGSPPCFLSGTLSGSPFPASRSATSYINLSRQPQWPAGHPPPQSPPLLSRYYLLPSSSPPK